MTLRELKPATIGSPNISAELFEMERVGQAIRTDPNVDPAKWEEVDRIHTARLKEIVAEIGWPTRSKVGASASYAAWLLARHADSDLNVQQHALSLMRDIPESEVSPSYLAYLEDRVRVN